MRLLVTKQKKTKKKRKKKKMGYKQRQPKTNKEKNQPKAQEEKGRPPSCSFAEKVCNRNPLQRNILINFFSSDSYFLSVQSTFDLASKIGRVDFRHGFAFLELVSGF